MSAVHTRNILRAFDACPDDVLSAGLSWYADAAAICDYVAEPFDLGLEVSAGVCAALSPRLSWTKNVEYMGTMLEHGTAPTLPLSRQKALRILQGEPAMVVLGGLKTTSFYANILSQGADTGHVTIDRHAFRVATLSTAGDPYVSPKAYAEISQSYRNAARARGITPAQMQATVWIPVAQ